MKRDDKWPDLGVPLWFKVWSTIAITGSCAVCVVVIWALVELVRWVTR